MDRLIISSQRSASTYCLLLHERAYHCLSEPWDPASPDHARTPPQDRPWCLKCHAREVQQKPPGWVRDTYPDIWVLQRRDRVGQILSLAVARQRDLWSTHSVTQRDLWLTQPCELSRREVESARRSIDAQARFLEDFPADHRVFTEDLTGDVHQDSDLWLIPPSQQCDDNQVRMGGARPVISNLADCELWLR